MKLPSEQTMRLAGIQIVSKRNSYRKKIKYCKLTAIEVIEEREWPGKYIPIIPVYGRHVVIGDKRKKFGMVRHGKDVQADVQLLANLHHRIRLHLAPKAKWLMAEGQDEGHENDWAQANVMSMPLLQITSKLTLMADQAPAPQRLQPEPPPAGIMAAIGWHQQRHQEPSWGYLTLPNWGKAISLAKR
jgi:hypothetical protein